MSGAGGMHDPRSRTRVDGSYSVVRSDSSPAKAAEDAEDARAFAGEVRVHYGPFRIGIPAAAVGAAACWIASRFFSPNTPVDCASRGDMNAVQKQVSDLTEAQRALTQTIARNADIAHNETRDIAVRLDSLRDQLAVQGRAPMFSERMSDALKR